MRRQEKQLSDKSAQTLLEQGEWGVLSTVSPDSTPYGVPVHYCFLNGNIYFHCACQGRKLDDIAANAHVSFCVVGASQVVAHAFTTHYQSVVISGRAVEVAGDEKELALKGLIEKYCLSFQQEGLEYIKSAGHKTRVIKIIPDSITGKGNPS